MIFKLALILFSLGSIGYILNRNNILYILLALEIMLLGVSFLFIYISILFDEIYPLVYSLYILVLAGAESAIGLGLLITFYKKRGSLEFPI